MPDEPTVEQLLRQILKQLQTTRDIPSTALVLRQQAVRDGVEHIRGDRRFDRAQVMLHNAEALRATLAAVPTWDGMLAEFGVYRGTSLTTIAQRFPDVTVHGFDSFIGLPEAWGGAGESVGSFDVGGTPPELPVDNVKFHVGLFDQTVPKFAAETTEPLRFAHLDADLYSSTKIVFEQLRGRFIPGTVVVFDEYFGYHGWQQHEHKAFEEFLAASGLTFEAIAVGHMSLAVRLLAR
jgi:Macrocin-O-methyltransferase (TylF)